MIKWDTKKLNNLPLIDFQLKSWGFTMWIPTVVEILDFFLYSSLRKGTNSFLPWIPMELGNQKFRGLKPIKRHKLTVKRQSLLPEELPRERTNSKINLSVRFFFRISMKCRLEVIHEWFLVLIAIEQVCSIGYKVHMLWGTCAPVRFSVTLLDGHSGTFSFCPKAWLRYFQGFASPVSQR